MRSGVHGKVPAAADFVSFGLPSPLSQWWDRALAAGLGEGRDRLGEAWEAAFDAAPRARIGLGSVEGHGFGRLIATWRPSRDGVGRRFPFTVVAFGPGLDVGAVGASPTHPWLDAAHDLADAVHDGRLALSELGRAVTSLPSPPATDVAGEIAGCRWRWVDDRATPWPTPLGVAGDLPSGCPESAR